MKTKTQSINPLPSHRVGGTFRVTAHSVAASFDPGFTIKASVDSCGLSAYVVERDGVVSRGITPQNHESPERICSDVSRGEYESLHAWVLKYAEAEQMARGWFSTQAYIARYPLDHTGDDLSEVILERDSYASAELFAKWDAMVAVRERSEPMLQLWYCDAYSTELLATTNQPFPLS